MKNNKLQLNTKQEDFLLAVGRNKDNCIRFIGRDGIYKTDMSTYSTRNVLISLNLIRIEKRKNKEIASLTKKGLALVKKISEIRFSKRKDNSSL